VLPQRYASRGTVLYFTGCGTQYAYDAVGHAIVRVLRQLGFRVEIPQGQVCCGLPMFFHGNLKQAQPNLLRNIELFNRTGIVAVVVDCATCGEALKKVYATVLAELGQDSAPALELAGKVWDITEFVCEHYELLEKHLLASATAVPVTYHSPCHLRNSQAAESLLERLPGVDYIRADDRDDCCGGGGTFFYDFPDTARQMAARKIDNARATGARLWATGCPGCRVNLAGNLEDRDRIRVLHPVELVAMQLIP
jgi:glycolate oxidase iron-sulfur subunit